MTTASDPDTTIHNAIVTCRPILCAMTRPHATEAYSAIKVELVDHPDVPKDQRVVEWNVLLDVVFHKPGRYQIALVHPDGRIYTPPPWCGDDVEVVDPQQVIIESWSIIAPYTTGCEVRLVRIGDVP